MNVEAPILPFDEVNPRPIVRLPPERLAAPWLAVLMIGAALFLFLALNHQRTAQDNRPQASSWAGGRMITSPAPLTLPTPPPAYPVAVVPVFVSSQPARASITTARVSPPSPNASNARPRALEQPAIGYPQAVMMPAPLEAPPPEVPAPRSLTAPAIVMDQGATQTWSGGKTSRSRTVDPEISAGPAGSLQPAKSSKSATPQSIGDPSLVVAGGTMIEAVLETPIDTSRPGLARAIVSRNVPSFDGSRMLIPRGSRLLGELGGEEQSGKRVLVNWKRLVRPDGSSLDLDSPGADAMGQAGLTGRSHGSGIGRFVSGILQTAINVGASFAAPRGSTVLYGLPVGATAGQLIPQAGERRRRVTVDAGAKINVFVARTLDFGPAGLSPSTQNGG